MTQCNTSSLKSTAQEVRWKLCVKEQLNILVSKNGCSARLHHTCTGESFFLVTHCGVKVHDYISVCFVSQHPSVIGHRQTSMTSLPPLYQHPACLPPSASVPACICCFTGVSNILIAPKTNCFQLGINQVELKQDVCLPAFLSL